MDSGQSKQKYIDILVVTKELLKSDDSKIKEGESDGSFEENKLEALNKATDGVADLLGKLSSMRDDQEKSLWNLADALDFIANYGPVEESAKHSLELTSCRKPR